MRAQAAKDTHQQKVHEEAMRAQAETNVLLVESNRQALKEQQQTNLQLQAQIQNVARSVAQSVQTPQPLLPTTRAAVQKSLQKMTPTDDVEAYLAVFERVAEREQLPMDQWAGVVAPFLTGKPQKAYFDLSEQDAKVYSKLKGEILARLGVNMSVRARKVHNWTFSEQLPARSQMYDLVHLVKKWL